MITYNTDILKMIFSFLKVFKSFSVSEVSRQWQFSIQKRKGQVISPPTPVSNYKVQIDVRANRFN